MKDMHLRDACASLALRRRGRHWLDRQMAWLDRSAIPLSHTTSNHTAYDRQSEAIFREVLVRHRVTASPPGSAESEGLPGSTRPALSTKSMVKRLDPWTASASATSRFSRSHRVRVPASGPGEWSG
jgi:hypothetical protein